MRLLLICATLVVALALPGAASAAPTPGAAGLGDRLFPTLGNGGYDVVHYDVAWRYPTTVPATPVTGTVTIDARATQSLASFNLDFSGTSYGAVAVNGRPAAVEQAGEDIEVTPEEPIRKGARFRVVVARYTATPTPVDPEDDSSTAFFSTPDGTATAAQPNLAHLFLPSNDHPRDKASFTFHLDVPDGDTAVASGVLVSRTSSGPGRTTWTYHQPEPMATELVQIAAGHFDMTPRGVVDGVPVRDVTPRRLTAQLEPALATVTAHVPWMQDRVGRYPFRLYGSLVVDDIPFALETQTLSVFGLSWFTQLPRGVWEPTMVHEIAHQWFGNSVSPWEWSDLWLNEGHATWYQITWAEEHGRLAENTAGQFNEAGYADLESYMRAVYAAGDAFRAQFGPVGLPRGGTVEELFTPNEYQGGALVLYALRQEIGPERFAALQRAWVTKHAYGVASTADFARLASKVAGRDLTAFLEAWVYGETTPPMPGHPDWTVDPVPAELPPA